VPLKLRRPPSRSSSAQHADSNEPLFNRHRRLWVPAARAVVWTTLAFVMIRGIGDVLADDRAPVPSGSGRKAAAAWPDDEARAFAIRFARAYLTPSRRYPAYQTQTLTAMAAPELRDDLVDVATDSGWQAVDQATVARVTPLSADRALITVACLVLGKTVSTRLLTVPVERDARGDLVVFDQPSFTSPPRRGESSGVDGEPLTGEDNEAIEGLLRRFLKVYLAGDEEQLPYFLTPGATLAPLGHAYELLDVAQIARLDRSRVAATVRARDGETGAVYTLRYRVALARGDRWLVQAVDG
jgi:Conjugative transposon protein TcpC